MRDNTIVRILWLSDIHFRYEYDKDVFDTWCSKISVGKEEDERKKWDKQCTSRKSYLDDVQTYINLFLTQVKDYLDTIQDKERIIHYVLISGDLASRGNEEDYTSLHKMLVGPLMDLLGNSTRFLTIPGNHDVNRNGGKFLTWLYHLADIIPSGQLQKQLSQMRSKFVEDNADHFGMIFAPYRKYFLKYILPTHTDLSILCPQYQEDGFFGHLIDKRNNLFINLLNTSWFSLGSDFDKHLINDFMNNASADLLKYNIKEVAENPDEIKKIEKKIEKSLKSHLKKLLDAKNLVFEYGGQVYGDELIKKDPLETSLSDNEGLCVLTSFHHPLNWIEYGKKYGHDDSSTQELFLTKLLNKTHLLLTGHEHVPSHIKIEKTDDTYHIKGGMFMQDDMLAEKFEQHRFSILEINTSDYWFKEQQFVFDWDLKKWNWVTTQRTKTVHWLQKREHVLSPAKEQRVLEKLQNPDILNQLFAQYFPFLQYDCRYSPMFEIQHLEVKFSTCFIKGRNPHILVIPYSNIFMDLVTKAAHNKTDTVHPFDILLQKANLPASDHSVAMMLLIPDFLADINAASCLADPTSADYKEKQIQLHKRANAIFNLSRHNFFNRFEQELLKNSGMDIKDLKINELEFSRISQLQLSMQVIPFWLIDKYSTPP